MSKNQDFQPLTPQLGIAGTSYQLQMGKVNNFWAIRLLKGKSVLASKVYKDTNDIPLGNHLMGWVLSVLTLPNINTYQIQKTIGFIRQKAIRSIEDQKIAKQTAGKSESKTVTLGKIPDNVQIKRPQAAGWVKDDDVSSLEGKVAAADLSPALAASNSTATGQTEGTASFRGRDLQSIPTGKGFVRSAVTPKVKSAGGSSVDNKVIPDILERLQQLEYTVRDLEADNMGIRRELQAVKERLTSKK